MTNVTPNWDELFALSQRESSDRSLIERLLDHWSSAHGAEAVALYHERGAQFERDCAIGADDFPEIHDPAAPTAEMGKYAMLRLPGSALFFAPAGAPLLDSATLLLAQAARARRLARQLQEQRFQANYRGVELEALYDVGLKIASTLDSDALSEEILPLAVSLLDARRGALYLSSETGYRRARTFGGDAAEQFAADDAALERFLAGEGVAPSSLLPGARHLLGAAIEAEGVALGFLAVGDKESRRGVGPFKASDGRTLGLFANQAAIALQNARLHQQALEKERLEREMSLASEIQRQILPKGAPEIPGYDFAGWNRPARQVGGDYYDFLRLPEGRLGLAVGDVSGKGMPAALLVSTLHSALRLLPERDGIGAAFLERLNEHFLESSTANKFVTLFLAELDLETGLFDYLNAGHNPGLLLRANGEIESLGAGGLPLGLLPGARYRVQSSRLETGDLLCLYSDGITECSDIQGDEFGAERLADLLRAQANAPVTEIACAIDHACVEFAQGQPQGDDQTVLLVRRG